MTVAASQVSDVSADCHVRRRGLVHHTTRGVELVWGLAVAEVTATPIGVTARTSGRACRPFEVRSVAGGASEPLIVLFPPSNEVDSAVMVLVIGRWGNPVRQRMV